MNIYDACTQWIRANHSVNVSNAYPSYWSCSCGKRGNPDTIPTFGRSRAAADRHLRAERKKWMADQQAYLDHLRRSGEIEDAKGTML